jgi:hypothetical protein
MHVFHTKINTGNLEVIISMSVQGDMMKTLV